MVLLITEGCMLLTSELQRLPLSHTTDIHFPYMQNIMQ